MLVKQDVIGKRKESNRKWMVIRGPFYQRRTRISNHMPSKVCGEITYPFPNFNGATVKIWEGISNFLPYFIINVITYPYWD